jgi:hypothetical protein
MSSTVRVAKKTNQQKNCQICLDDIESDIEFLPCIHAFHRKCISLWLVDHPTCPICKTPIHIQTPQQLVDYNENKKRREERDARESRFFQNISSSQSASASEVLSNMVWVDDEAPEPSPDLPNVIGSDELSGHIRIPRAHHVIAGLDTLNNLVNRLSDNQMSQSDEQTNNTSRTISQVVELLMNINGEHSHDRTYAPYPAHSNRQARRIRRSNQHVAGYITQNDQRIIRTWGSHFSQNSRFRRLPYAETTEESPAPTLNLTRHADLDISEYMTISSDRPGISVRNEPESLRNLTGEYDTFQAYAADILSAEHIRENEDIFLEHGPTNTPTFPGSLSDEYNTVADIVDPSQVALGESDDVPSESDDVPSESDDVPSESDDVPSESDDVPSEI